MRFPIKFLTLLLVLVCIHHSEEWFGGRRRRRLIPPIRIPPVRRIVRRVGKTLEKAGKGLVKGVTSLAKGCCGLKPWICRSEKEFKNRQYDIKRKSASMDRDWIRVKKILANIKVANNDNSKIYSHVRRITLSSSGTIEILDPEIIVKFNNVSNELKKAIEHKNQTVLNYGINELQVEYDKKKTGTETALLDASGIGGFGMSTGYLKMTADMFRLIKLDSVAKFMETKVGGFLNKAKLGVSKLFGFHYLQELGKQNKILGGVLKAFTFYNNYLSLHGGVFKLMEGFNKLVGWITDLAGCGKRGNQIRNSLKKLKKDHVKINDAYRKLQKYKREVNKNWVTVRRQISSDGLLTNLRSIEDIARQSSTQSTKLKRALAEIVSFRVGIKRANAATTIRLQKRLIHALSNIKFSMDCYRKKLAVYEAVHKRCKLGQASFQELYIQALIDFKANTMSCRGETGLPYTSKPDVLKYVKVKANKEKFEINCLLNSGVKKALTCESFNEGYSHSQVASLLQLELNVVRQYEATCATPVLTPIDVSEICTLKTDNVHVHEIYSKFPRIEKTKVRTAYGKCS